MAAIRSTDRTSAGERFAHAKVQARKYTAQPSAMSEYFGTAVWQRTSRCGGPSRRSSNVASHVLLYWRDKYPLHGSACHWSGAPYSSRKTPDTLNQRPPAALTGPWIPKRPWRWAQYCRIGAQQNVPRGAALTMFFSDAPPAPRIYDNSVKHAEEYRVQGFLLAADMPVASGEMELPGRLTGDPLQLSQKRKKNKIAPL
ncbi:hypothetical protein N5P37_009433 [Trichoderma harzianum]|uniref:Uncharacterized protein n=1 Tax=Trichoderma harzianum CBS 226.95 TaxID=983964 RepID=A0A2T4A7Y1_TRIHA|nr:hypothetical protein M431DRAFT_483331 [Trichoderma harzianum CBS 226.95]KAK0758132.1 hypothetical protein N5P37_009433 [Trichoderma harzianum]PTB53161.1 hypothetical protein M431DRAFT_483331 [Trichoderma harzianum CBS 226.95]